MDFTVLSTGTHIKDWGGGYLGLAGGLNPITGAISKGLKAESGITLNQHSTRQEPSPTAACHSVFPGAATNLETDSFSVPPRRIKALPTP